ncbi:Mad17 [Candidatus Magnetomoraceae bacterium gMMP-15]
MNTKKEKKVVGIIGLPNSGKTQIFNNLTGKYHLVANSPLTTIDLQRADVKIDGQSYELVDTLGIHKLYIYSNDELITRDFIFVEKPDIIIQIIDANRLKQSLSLTADLLELGTPLVLVLNAVDETSRKGIWIDSKKLTRLLHVPVIECVAVNSLGTQALREAIINVKATNWEFNYGNDIEKELLTIESLLPEAVQFKRNLSVLLLMEDPFVADDLKKLSPEIKTKVKRITEQVKEVQKKFPGNINRIINTRKSDWVDELEDELVMRQETAYVEVSERFARLSRNPETGIPILLMILYVMYLLVVHVANKLAELMDGFLWVPVAEWINTLVAPGFWNDFLIGDYGILSLGLANAVITIFPILSVFFIMFNILEDMGYIPNLCVLTKRLFEKFGLSGSAMMPLVLGFGCKTMATLTTKSLYSKRERYISIYLIAFAIPCAAQMGLNMSILGKIGILAFIITFSVLTLSEIIAGITLNKILPQEIKDDFLLELPPIRFPNPKAVLIKTYYRLYWFFEEAVLVFIYAALALFLLDKSGLLDASKHLLSPIINGFLGLPIDMVDALILCMARHEAAAGMIMKLIDNGKLDFIQCIVAVTITTMFVPCFANIMAMIKELGTAKAVLMTVIINISSFIIAGCLNWLLIGSMHLGLI